MGSLGTQQAKNGSKKKQLRLKLPPQNITIHYKENKMKTIQEKMIKKFNEQKESAKTIEDYFGSWDYINFKGFAIAEVKYSNAYGGCYDNHAIIDYVYGNNEPIGLVTIGTIDPYTGKLKPIEPEKEEKWFYPPVEFECKNVRKATIKEVEEWLK